MATGSEDFYYDPGVFFDARYTRYKYVFTIDGNNLEDPPKVKIGPSSMSGTSTVSFLSNPAILAWTKFYGRKTSLFNDRYYCLQYINNDADNLSSCDPSVNKHCKAFQLSKLSDDPFKALRFVCGLQPRRNADIGTIFISKLEAEERRYKAHA